MSKKTRRHFTIYESTLENLENLEEETGISRSGVIDLAVSHYLNFIKDKEQDLHDLARQQIIAMNEVDKKLEMINQFWNHYFYLGDHQSLATTEKFKTIPFSEGKEFADRKIAKARQRKIDADN